jgi:hypothetical protein
LLPFLCQQSICDVYPSLTLGRYFSNHFWKLSTMEKSYICFAGQSRFRISGATHGWLSNSNPHLFIELISKRQRPQQGCNGHVRSQETAAMIWTIFAWMECQGISRPLRLWQGLRLAENDHACGGEAAHIPRRQEKFESDYFLITHVYFSSVSYSIRSMARAFRRTVQSIRYSGKFQ